MRIQLRAAWLLAALATGLAYGARPARAAELCIGDPAPKLALGDFVKGETIKELKAGTTYVLEFWATWCGPCKAAIPHVTELAKKYPAVKFIGVDVWERDLSLVKPFVAEMGDKMGYNVAYDTPIAGSTAGQMAVTWMQAAGRNGIPCSFVVNKDTKIAYIGHPMQMAEPLAQIVAGTWDLTKARADYVAEQNRQKKVQAISTELRKPSLTVDARIKLLRDWFAEDSGAETQYGVLLVRELAKLTDASDLRAFLAKTKAMDSSDGANCWRTADSILAVREASPGALALALALAKRADALLGGQDALAVAVLGRAYTRSADRDNAIGALRRALRVAGPSPYTQLFRIWLREAENLPVPRPDGPYLHGTLN